MLTPSQITTLQASKASAGGGDLSGVQKSQPMNDQQFQAWSGVSKPAMPATDTNSPQNIDPNSENMKKISTGITVNQVGNEVKGFGSDLAQHANNIGDVFKTGLDAGKKGQVVGLGDLITGGTKIAAEATAPIGDVFKRGFSALTDILSNSPELQKLANSNAGTKALNTVQGAGEQAGIIAQPAKDALAAWAQQHPQVAQTIGNLAKTGLNLSMVEGGGEVKAVAGDMAKAGGEVLNEGANIASDVGTIAKNKITSMLPEAKPVVAPALDEAKIAGLYNRSIKPSISGTRSAADIAKANSQKVVGAKAIVENKAGLEFTDANGETIKGQVPTNVQQTSEAIQQTKSAIYDKYNKLAVEAGQKGISVNTRQIGMELDPVIKSKSLAISNPEAVKYAQDLQTRLWKNGEVDAKTAQEVIQNYNAELKNYYRNPQYGLSSKVQIDAMVANNMRKYLDDGITNATGEQYQSLKDQYGALSSMEKDVAKKAASLAKANNVGFVANLSNIASGAELVRGLVTMNPVDMAVSGTIKGIQMYTKYLNDPDVNIGKMFSEIERKSPSPTMPTQPGAGTEIKSSDKPTTFIPKSQTGKMIQEAKKNGTQGGYVKIPGGKIVKSIDDPTKQEIYGTIKYLDSGKVTKAGEQVLDTLAEKYGISRDLSVSKIKSRFTDLLDKTKTS